MSKDQLLGFVNNNYFIRNMKKDCINYLNFIPIFPIKYEKISEYYFEIHKFNVDEENILICFMSKYARFCDNKKHWMKYLNQDLAFEHTFHMWDIINHRFCLFRFWNILQEFKVPCTDLMQVKPMTSLFSFQRIHKIVFVESIS